MSDRTNDWMSDYLRKTINGYDFMANKDNTIAEILDEKDFAYKVNHNGYVLFYRGVCIGGETSQGDFITPDGLPGNLRNESVNPNVSETYAKGMIGQLCRGWIPRYMAELIRQINETKGKE